MSFVCFFFGGGQRLFFYLQTAVDAVYFLMRFYLFGILPESFCVNQSEYEVGCAINQMQGFNKKTNGKCCVCFC